MNAVGRQRQPARAVLAEEPVNLSSDLPTSEGENKLAKLSSFVVSCSALHRFFYTTVRCVETQTDAHSMPETRILTAEPPAKFSAKKWSQYWKESGSQRIEAVGSHDSAFCQRKKHASPSENLGSMRLGTHS